MPKVCLCYNHPERPTPLLSTFAFHGAEFWCSWCGAKEGMFNGCEKVEETPALAATAAEDEARSKEYLTAVSSLSCDRLLWQGTWISPSDLPIEVVEQFRKTRAAWKYPAEQSETAAAS